MSIDSHTIEVSGITVEVVRKQIKNLHLGVYPPDGRVRVATPMRLSDEAVRLAVVSRLGWIRRERANMQQQPRESQREYISGESHYFQGRRYRLRVITRCNSQKVEIVGKRWLCLCVKKGADRAQREKVLERWYREELKRSVAELIAKWEPLLGVNVSACGIKKMKTKWGSCNIEERRIWINLELAKKPVHSLEYIVVHEMVHLLEKHHNERFKALMDKFLPQWRIYKAELGKSPLGHQEWQNQK